VDREFVTLFMIFDENESWYLDANIERLTEPGAVEPEREEFVESNPMHSINGYVFGNLPGLAMKPCERVR
jgi:ceruloplasmin